MDISLVNKSLCRAKKEFRVNFLRTYHVYEQRGLGMFSINDLIIKDQRRRRGSKRPGIIK